MSFRVSTHAPARGATIRVWDMDLWRCVSTHAPARRATIIPAHLSKRIQVSTHAPARGATYCGDTRCAGAIVSTHAPARGATGKKVELRSYRGVSTHAPARGATPGVFFSFATVKFQPTHPHGVRPSACSNSSKTMPGFNPRTRTGCDRAYLLYGPPSPCFNPRTRTGCDRFLGCCAQNSSVSTHAPARGATWLRSPIGSLGTCFNPRTRTGCDAS